MAISLISLPDIVAHVGNEMVVVVLSTANAKLYGVTFDGFPNSEYWADEEVLAWANEQLEGYRIDD